MNPAEFRESLREIGPLLPVITCGGHEIDGRQRRKICAEVGRNPTFVELAPAEALRALWILHPERALERAGTRSVDDYARAFGVRTLTVANYLQQQRLQTPIVDPAELGAGGRSRMVQTFWSPRLHYLATVAARERGLNLSAFVREAVATHIARTTGLEVPALQQDGRSGPRRARTVPGVEHRPRQDTPDMRTREARRGR